MNRFFLDYCIFVYVNERKVEIDNNFILYIYFKNRKNIYDINRKKYEYLFMKNQDIFYLKIKIYVYNNKIYNIGNFQSIDWMELYERYC